MKPNKLLLIFLGLLNIFLAFFIPGYYVIMNIIVGWVCLFDGFSSESVFDYIFN